MRRKLADQVMERLAKSIPEPRTELYFETPFQLLVSVVLSAQTTDKMVNACMRPLYEKGFDIDDVLSLGAEGLLGHVRRLSFGPTKARHVAALAHALVERHGGEVPNDRAALEALPGVGRKTASVVLGEIYGAPTLAVDTHVFRVGARLALHRAKSPDKAEPELLEAIDARHLPKAHHYLLLHGRYTCKAIKPDCERCILNGICPSLWRSGSKAARGR